MSSRVGIAPHVKRSPNKHGLIMVSTDYRLAPQTPLPEIVADIGDAVQWVRNELPKNAGAFKVDTERLMVAGGSAGGFLAMLSALPVCKSKPAKAIGAVYPITDPSREFFICGFRPLEWQNGRIITADDMAMHIDPSSPVLTGTPPPVLGGEVQPPSGRGWLYDYALQEGIMEKMMFEKAPDSDRDAFKPPKQIGTGYPPLYVFHGAEDTRVGVSQSDELAEALKNVGGLDWRYERIEGGQHLFDIMDPSVEMEGLYDWFKSKV